MGKVQSDIIKKEVIFFLHGGWVNPTSPCGIPLH